MLKCGKTSRRKMKIMKLPVERVWERDGEIQQWTSKLDSNTSRSLHSSTLLSLRSWYLFIPASKRFLSSSVWSSKGGTAWGRLLSSKDTKVKNALHALTLFSGIQHKQRKKRLNIKTITNNSLVLHSIKLFTMMNSYLWRWFFGLSDLN